MTAYYRTMQNASDAAVNMAKSAGDATINLQQIPKVSKIGQTALQGLAMAGNMLVMALASKAVAFVAEKISESANASEIAAAKAAGFTDTVKNFHAGIAGGASEIAGLNAEYNELKKGVNDLGQNIGLSAEQYERYKEIVGKISDLMPDLTARFNEQGEAIAFTKKGITDLGDEYETYLKRQAKNYLINGDENGNTFQDAIDSFGANSRHGFFENVKHTFKHAFGIAGIDDIPVDTMIGTLSAMQNKTKDEIAAYLSDIDIGPNKEYLFTESNRAKAIAEDLLDINLSKIRAQSDEEFALLQENIAAHIESLQNSNTVKMEAITSGLLTAAYSKDDFWKMDDGDRDDVAAILSSFTPDIWKEIGGSTQAEVEQFAGTVINAVSENKDGFADAWNGLFQLDLDSIPVTEHVAQVNTFMDTLCGVLGIDDPEHQKQFMVSLGFDVETDQAMVNGVKQKIDAAIHGDRTAAGAGAVLIPKLKTDEQLKLEQWVETLTESELTLIADGAIRFDENTTVESAQNALEAARRAVRDATPLSYTESLASIETLSDGLNQLDGIYADIADKGTFDWGSILNNEGFKQTFGELGAAYDAFIKTVSTSPDNLQACQGAFDRLAATYIHNSGALDSLTESTKEAAIAMLKQQGITNAEEIVTERLAGKKLAQKAAVDALNWANETSVEKTMTSVQALLTDTAAADTAKLALYDLLVQETIFSNTSLSVTEKIAALGKLAAAYGITADAAQLASGYTDEKTVRLMQHYGATDEQIENYFKDKYQRQIEEKFKTTLTDPTYGGIPTPKPTGGAADGAKDAAPDAAPVKETAETLNWIDKKLETAAKLTDKLAKAFDRAFGVSGARETYKTYLAQIEAEIGANETAAKYYQDRLRQIGLSYEWIAKIQTGDFSVDSISDENLKAQIGEYRTYSDKLTACYDTLESLEEKRLQAAVNYAGKEIEAREKEIAAVDKLIARRKALVALKELFHVSASKADLSYQQKKYETELDMLEEQNRKLLELMRTTTYGDEAWQKYNEQMLKNTDTARDLVQTIADLAVELANLPLDKYEKFLDKNAGKNDLYVAKQNNATNARGQNKMIDRQIGIVKQNDKKAQDTAKATEKNLNQSIKDMNSAKKKDYGSTKIVTGELGPVEQVRKKLDDYYKQTEKYTKSKKQIPASLITKIADDGYASLAAACANYNAQLAANETAQATAALSKENAAKDIAGLAKQKFDNIAAEYDYRIFANEQKKTAADNRIARKEANGRKASTADYKELIAAEQAEQKKYTDKHDRLQKELDQAVADGAVKEGAEEWYAMIAAVNEAANAAAQAEQSVIQYKNAMRQLKWDAFDRALENITRINGEADYYLNRLSRKKLVDNETGEFTEAGVATLALRKETYKSDLAQADAYQKEYNELMKKVKKGELSRDDEAVVERLRELQDRSRDAKLAAEDELEAIQDLVRQGYDAQLNALGSLIDRYKDMKNVAADAYNYQRQIEDKIKTIAALQKRLSVYGTNTSEETRAQIQRLKVELQDARDDLRDTQYEKYRSDAEEMLEDLSNDYTEFIDEKLNDTNDILGEISGLLGDEGAIIATLKEIDKNLSGELAALINGDTTAEKQTGDAVEKEKKEADKPTAETAKPKPAAETGGRAAKTALIKPKEKSVSEKVAAYLNASSEEEAQALVRSGEALAVDENIRQLLERAGQTPVILETPDIIKNGFPPLPSPPAFLENLGDNIRVETGKIDIVMNGVNDVETFGRQLREEICRNGKTTQCIAEAVSAKQLGRGIGSARLHR